MILKDAVNQIVEDFLQKNNQYLVDLKVSPDNRIQIEIDSFRGVSLDDCVLLNRHIESLLDREVEDYELEISSAGLTEPFKVLNQYKKNAGKEVEVLTKAGIKLRGILGSADETGFELEFTKSVKPEGAKRKIDITEKVKYTYNDIKTTKLIISFK